MSLSFPWPRGGPATIVDAITGSLSCVSQMYSALLALVIVFGVSSCAQDVPGDESHTTSPPTAIDSAMDHSHGGHSPKGGELVDVLQLHATSGTDAFPSSTPMQMLMKHWSSWEWMVHGQAFLNDTQQSGARGADKLFSTNWFMIMGQRRLGNGLLTLRTMLSLEPATVTGREYPEVLQQGETAFSRPIVDGQHPHDFFMEIAALYDWRVRENAVLSVYVAPHGDPALGPLGYPHRPSASENPIAPLGHHLQDSTHLAADVVTVGVTYRNFRLEASGFHGREPDENRWNIDSGAIDSWSTRVSINPGRNWSFQYSVGNLRSPEAIAPADNIRRMTASLMYNRPLPRGNWASTFVWGRNQSLLDGNVGNGYLLESTLRFAEKNYVWTRIENVDRTNELLLPGVVDAHHFSERYFTRVQAYTAGYDRDIATFHRVALGLGAQFTAYSVPTAIAGIYGQHPVGGVVFLRLRTH